MRKGVNDEELWLSRLKEQISYWNDPANKTNKTIEIIHLFYDN